MFKLLGLLRLISIAVLISIAMLCILASSWMPITVRGIRISQWVPTMLLRFAMRTIFNVKVTSNQPRALHDFSGFVFPNHSSYLDVLVLLYLHPVRFVAKREVIWMPIVGLAAWGFGTIFVKRENRASRRAARQKLARIRHYPPILLYPEGKRNDGQQLLPFRQGAFDIVTQGEVPFTPCAIYYDRQDIVGVRSGQSMIAGAFRLVSNRKPIHATLHFLETIQPQRDGDHLHLAAAVQQSMGQLLYQHGGYQLPAPTP